jgi:hypothetical protein
MLTSAGQYTLEASIAGLPPQTADVSVLSGDVRKDFYFTAP